MADSPSDNNATAAPASERIAILVIHGIGQQQPYETLDQFAHGLLNSYARPSPSGAASAPWTIQPQLDLSKDPLHIQHGWVRASYRLTPPSPPPYVRDGYTHRTIQDITLFEYYWAPITQSRITYTGSLLFLIKAGLKPFKYFASNLDILSSGNRTHVFKVVLKELWRQACLFLPLILFLGALLAWLSLQSPTQLLAVARTIPADTIVLLLLLAIRYLYLFTTLGTLRKSLLAKRATVPQPSTAVSPCQPDSKPHRSNWQSSPIWRITLLAVLLGHIFLWPVTISWFAHAFSKIVFNIASFFRDLASHISPPSGVLAWLSVHFGICAATLDTLAAKTAFSLHPREGSWLVNIVLLKSHIDHLNYIALAVFALLAYWVRFILISYVGDVAVYVNADEFSNSFSARSQILNECTSALSAILRASSDPASPPDPDHPASPASRPFDRVLVAGHSLGSVIAYDTINELLNRARAADPGKSAELQAEQLDKLCGMVTFGSPLNKIFYLFREQIDARFSLRRQTIDLLHGFRVLPQLTCNPGTPLFTPNPDPRWSTAEAALASGFCWINAYSFFDPISGKLAFYDLGGDVNQCRFHYKVPILAHLSYWTDPDFYDFVRHRLL